jgi:NAD(P)-dependent dehydrogenase (short-subunit alcohol dehydrogenase family)
MAASSSQSSLQQPLRGKICLVTGASSGIGKATARGLASLGAKVIMVCRNHERGERALLELQLALGGAKLYLLCADLSSQREVRRLAEEVRKNFDALHVLVNNAGVYCQSRQVSADGIERTLAVNHLAPFLLTRLLLDLLRASAPARIVNVGSAAYRQGRIRLDDLNLQREYRPFTAYAQSKLALLLSSLELAERLQGSGVTVNCLHPGFTATEIYRDLHPALRFLLGLMGRSPERSARSSLHLAASHRVEGVSGKFFIGERPAVVARHAQDAALRRELWELSEALTREAQPPAGPPARPG